tara:strand:- start:235 stop:477 length:243 start_codon:yes stop_codon:yes gene_type:complete
MNINSIKEKIENSILNAKVEVKDSTGTGDHFSVLVISNEFKNMSLVNRHQLIYKSLNKYITKEIHALQIKAYTEEELSNV